MLKRKKLRQGGRAILVQISVLSLIMNLVLPFFYVRAVEAPIVEGGGVSEEESIGKNEEKDDSQKDSPKDELEEKSVPKNESVEKEEKEVTPATGKASETETEVGSDEKEKEDKNNSPDEADLSEDAQLEEPQDVNKEQDSQSQTEELENRNEKKDDSVQEEISTPESSIEIKEKSQTKEKEGSGNSLKQEREASKGAVGRCLEKEEKVKSSSKEDWNFDEEKGIAETKEAVKLGVRYEFPGEKNISVTFTCLPEETNTLKIQQIRLEDLRLPAEVVTVGDYAYDITTEMENGQFKYELELTKPKNTELVEVSYLEKTIDEIEEDLKLEDLKKIDQKKVSQKTEEDRVGVEGLDHFSIYFLSIDQPAVEFRTDVLQKATLSSRGQYTISSTSGIWTAVSGGSNISGLNTNEVRWGRTYGGKSGMRFDGSGVQSFNPNDKFLIGELTHLNWVLQSGSANGATLKVTLNFSQPPLSPKPTFTYNFKIKETTNTRYLFQCEGHGTDEQISSTPCDDVITFPSSYGQEVFTIGDVKYTLVVDGFQKTYPTGTPISKFVTEENKNSKAYLVGHLSSVLIEKPAISIVKKVNGEDANTAPGVIVGQGDPVSFQYVVQNTGNVRLTNITVTDDKGVTVSCPETALEPGANMICNSTGEYSAILGLYTNIGTVVGEHSAGTVTASDPANYTGVKKIDICHATGSHENPYLGEKVNMTADAGGHDGHNGPVWFPGINEIWGDIIPPFDYVGGHYPGKNWNTYGQSVLENGCVVPTGTLKVNKITNPANDDTSFDITGTGTPTVSGAPTFHNGNTGTISHDNAHTYIVSPGTYSVSETVPEGWEEVDNTCNGISIAEGENKECTITNTKMGQLIVKKIVINDNGGTLEAKDFSFKINDGEAISFEDDGQNEFTRPVGSTHSIVEVEANQRGYATTYDNCTDVTVPYNGTATCTITNNDIAPGLTVKKHVKNDNGGTATVADFGINLTDTTLAFDEGVTNGDTTTYTANPIVVSNKSYTLSETDHPDYTEGDWNCKDNTDGSSVSIPFTLSGGQSVTCEITNDDIAPVLILDKEVDNKDLPEDLKKSATDWTLTATGPTSISGVGQDNVIEDVKSGNDFKAGIYTLSETSDIAGFVSVAGWVCTGVTLEENNTVTLNIGDTATCKIVNESIYGKVIIEKQTLPDGDETEFSFSGTGVSEGASLKDGETTKKFVVPGEYDVTENLPAGWDLTNIYCGSDNDSSGDLETKTATINVSENEEVKCVFTNTKRGSVTIKKDAIPNNAQDFNFTNNFGNDHPNSFLLDDDNNATLPNERTFEVLPGEYTVIEDEHIEWSLTDLKCVDPSEDSIVSLGERKATIKVDPGEEIVCTFTNRKKPTLTVVKEVVNDNGGVKTVDDFGINFSGGELSFDDGTVAGSTTKYKSEKLILDPGEYNLSENDLFGYEEGTWDCGTTSEDGITTTIDLKYGKNVTCKIINDDIAPEITVIKKVNNDDSGAVDVNDFNITLTDTELTFDAGVTSGNTTTFTTVVSGESNKEYTLAEVVAGTGYTQDELSCTVGENGVFTLEEGQNVTCTIVNTRDLGELKVKKVIDADGDLNTIEDQTIAGDWEFDPIGVGVDTSDPLGAKTDLTDGAVVFRDLKTGEYNIAEIIQPGFDLVGANCDEMETILKENVLEGVLVQKDSQTACTFYNSPNSSISGYKWNDQNASGTLDESEYKLADWTINLYRKVGEDFEETPFQTTSTSSDELTLGSYSFDKLLPGEYKVCESLQTGWQQIYPEVEVNGGCHLVSLPTLENQEYNFGNQSLATELYISKTNNTKIGEITPIGNEVTYTIKVRAAENLVREVQITDLPPENFKYVADSWEAVSSVRGDLKNIAGLGLAKVYASPGIWILGDMAKDEEVTLSYRAKIEDKVTSGVHKDIALAKGLAPRAQGENQEVIALAESFTGGLQDGVVSTNFVGTQVEVARSADEVPVVAVKADKDKKVRKKEKVVVKGATTSRLPVTGASGIWILVAGAMLAGGLALVLFGRKKKTKNIMKVFLLALVLFGLQGAAQAQESSRLQVRINEPEAKLKTGFELGFVALDIDGISGDKVAVECLKKGPGETEFSGFQSVSLPAGGGAGICSVKEGLLSQAGKYEFRVSATSGVKKSNSNVVSADFSSGAPEKPEYLKKKKDFSCHNELEFKTASDGKTSRVEIYRSSSTTITTDAQSKITSIEIGPGVKSTFVDDLTSVGCNKDYYYAIRAFDEDNNPSPVREEKYEVKTTKTTIITETESATEREIVGGGVSGTVGGDVVTGEQAGGLIEGDATVAGEQAEDDQQDDEGTIISDGAATTEIEDSAEVLGEKTSQTKTGKMKALAASWKFWAMLVVIAGIVLAGIRYMKKEDQESA